MKPSAQLKIGKAGFQVCVILKLLLSGEEEIPWRRYRGAMTWLDTENPNMGPDAGEFPRVQGEAGGDPSNEGIKCRPCHNRGHTAYWEHRGEGQEDFPEEMTFALGHVRSMHFPRRWRHAEFTAVLRLAAL